MAEPASNPGTSRPEPSGMFREPDPAERSFPTAAVAIAAVVVLLVVGIFAFRSRQSAARTAPATTLQPLAAYAPQLHFSDVQLSESTNFAGGKETFVDGRITNTGTATVTGATVQVLFAPEGGGAPQLDTVPMALIRTRQPYIDTEPLSAAPLAPGAAADFRLTFDDVHPEWNQQVPEIHVTNVTTR